MISRNGRNEAIPGGMAGRAKARYDINTSSFYRGRRALAQPAASRSVRSKIGCTAEGLSSPAGQTQGLNRPLDSTGVEWAGRLKARRRVRRPALTPETAEPVCLLLPARHHRS